MSHCATSIGRVSARASAASFSFASLSIPHESTQPPPRANSRVLTRLALEEMRPAEVDYVIGQDKVGDPPRPLPTEGAGFLETSGSDIVLSAWKQAENGKGLILRFMETAGTPATETVHFDDFRIRAANLCSGLEAPETSVPVENNTIQVSFKPFEVVTARVELRPSP